MVGDVFIGLGFIAFAFAVNDWKKKVSLELARLKVQIEESLRLKEQLERLKRDVKNPSTELTDFLADVRVHGFGVVRMDPDHLIVRSPRRVQD